MTTLFRLIGLLLGFVVFAYLLLAGAILGFLLMCHGIIFFTQHSHWFWAAFVWGCLFVTWLVARLLWSNRPVLVEISRGVVQSFRGGTPGRTP